MQRNKWQVMVFLGMILAAASAFGQNVRAIQADIPFQFIVAGRTFPAGHYAVSVDDQIVHISNSIHQAALVRSVDVENLSPQSSGRLVFHRYADTYFLAQILPPQSTGKQLYPSRMEEELGGKRTR